LDSSFVFFVFDKPHSSVFAKHKEKSLIIGRLNLNFTQAACGRFF
jgi:hypothetical protein